MTNEIKRTKELKAGDTINCGFYPPARILRIRDLKSGVRKVELWIFGKGEKKTICLPQDDRLREFLIDIDLKNI